MVRTVSINSNKQHLKITTVFFQSVTIRVRNYTSQTIMVVLVIFNNIEVEQNVPILFINIFLKYLVQIYSQTTGKNIFLSK